MATKKKKVFVLDTNVLLHDYRCIYNFQENNVIIPITVLEELDRFKKGNDIINYHAREFTRELDKLSGDNLFNGGVSLGKGLGKLSIETGKPFSRFRTGFHSLKTLLITGSLLLQSMFTATVLIKM